MKRQAFILLGAATMAVIGSAALAQPYYTPGPYGGVYVGGRFYEGRSVIRPGYAPSDTPWASSNRINQTPSYAHPEGSGNPVIR
jgi:hypothetical protein